MSIYNTEATVTYPMVHNQIFIRLSITSGQKKSRRDMHDMKVPLELSSSLVLEQDVVGFPAGVRSSLTNGRNSRDMLVCRCA